MQNLLEPAKVGLLHAIKLLKSPQTRENLAKVAKEVFEALGRLGR